MKRLQLIVNIVLALAVIVLFVLHFTGIGRSENSSSTFGLSSGLSGDNNIYYVQIDTVISKFDMAVDLTGELQQKYNSSEAALKSKQSAYEKEVSDYQYKAQRGLITRTDAQNIEQTLYAKQQDLMQLQQDLSAEINEKNSVMQSQVINAIMEYLKANYSKYNYKYVLGTSFGGNILYANDSLDISQDVIKGLNTKYQEDTKKK
jgi:outer membrane protein